MNNLSFWKEWHPTNRKIYLALLIVFGFLIVSFVFIYPKGISNIVSWERISELKEVPVAQEPISVGLFSFSYELDYSVVLETFLGSNLQLSQESAIALLGVVALVWVFLLTIISGLEKFWYYVGVLFLLGLIILFQLEQLLWFGNTQKTGVIIAFVLFLVPTLYFQQVNPNASLLARIATFTIATGIMGILISLFTEVSQPFLTLAYYGLWVPILLSILFIFIIGHEVISFIVQLITQNNTSRSSHSLLHIFVLSLIYLLNLSLLYLKNIGTIDWDILYIDAFWLLLLLSVMGIWGFQKRENQYKFLFYFYPLGAIFYVLLSLLTLATIGFLSWQGNDPLLESLEDTIVYSQIGFSSLFFLYLIANFIQQLLNNQRVDLIMYRPNAFPYATALIGGAIVSLALFARGSFFAYSQILSGYYIGIGDLHWMKDDLFVAEQYYKLSDQYANNNHRANYALGALARQQDDPVLTAYYFQEALQKQPSPLAYVNSGMAYAGTNQYFDALFTLKEGVAAYPENSYLKNNLAMMYGLTDVLDTAIYLLTESSEDGKIRATAESNMLGLVGQKRNKIDIPTDTLVNEFVSIRDFEPTLINVLLLQGQSPVDSLNFLVRPEIPNDSTLNSFSFARLKNYLLYSSQVDTALLTNTESLAEMDINFPYTEELILAVAISEYRQNRIVDALKKLDRLQSVNVFKRNYYLNIIGLLALEQRNTRVATQYFAELTEKGYEDSRLKFAVSLTESLTSPDVTLDIAQRAWQDVLTDSTQSVFHEMAAQLLGILSLPFGEMSTDLERYQWLRYRGHELTTNQFEGTFLSFEDLSYGAIAAYDILEEKTAEVNEAMVPIIDELKKNESSLNYQGTIYLEWAWALATITNKNVTTWENRINMLAPQTRIQYYHKTYWQALLAQDNEQPQRATELYTYLLQNPFYEVGLVGAVNYLYSDQTEAAYHLLLDAIQTNPYSAILLQKYIIAALEIGMENYAEQSLPDLRAMVDESSYEKFLQEYEKVKDEQAVAF